MGHFKHSSLDRWLLRPSLAVAPLYLLGGCLQQPAPTITPPDEVDQARLAALVSDLPELPDEASAIRSIGEADLPGSLFSLDLEDGRSIDVFMRRGPVADAVALVDAAGRVQLVQEFSASGTSAMFSSGDVISLTKFAGGAQIRVTLDSTVPPTVIDVRITEDEVVSVERADFQTQSNATYGEPKDLRPLIGPKFPSRSQEVNAESSCDTLTAAITNGLSSACAVRTIIKGSVTSKVSLALRTALTEYENANPDADPETIARLRLGVRLAGEAVNRLADVGSKANWVSLGCLALGIATDGSRSVDGRPLPARICDVVEARFFNLTVINGTGSSTRVGFLDQVAVEAQIPDGSAFVRWIGDESAIEDPTAFRTNVFIVGDTRIQAAFLRLSAVSPVVLSLPERSAQLQVLAETNPADLTLRYEWSSPNAVTFAPSDSLRTTATLNGAPSEYEAVLRAFDQDRPIADTSVRITLRDEFLRFTAGISPQAGSVIASCASDSKVDIVASGTWDLASGFAADELEIYAVQLSPALRIRRTWTLRSALAADGTWRAPLPSAFTGNDGLGTYEFDFTLRRRAEPPQVLSQTRSSLFTLASIAPQQLADVTVRTARVILRAVDFGLEDGDLVDIVLNCRTVSRGLRLTNAGQSIVLDLEDGRNRLQILALNEGDDRPNTAEFSILAANGASLTTQQWQLTTGQVAEMSIDRLP